MQVFSSGLLPNCRNGETLFWCSRDIAIRARFSAGGETVATAGSKRKVLAKSLRVRLATTKFTINLDGVAVATRSPWTKISVFQQKIEETGTLTRFFSVNHGSIKAQAR